MAVKTQCPRCKQALSVPNKLAGSYANCPRCQGRFWVAKDAPVDAAANDAVAPGTATLTLIEVASGPAATTGLPLATPPTAPPQQAAAPAASPDSSSPATGGIPPPAPPRAYFPSVTPLAPTRPVAAPAPQPTAVQPDAPPAAPPKARKAARLVSADAAQSTLKIAADGQLPNLQLQDDETKDKAKAKTQVVSPLVLVGAWFLSIALTVAVVVLSAGDGSGGADSPDKIRAMRDIEDKFIGDTSRGAQYAYQKALRSAQRAHARGDLKAERKHFKEVLDLLRTESRGGGGSASGRDRLEKGVTGSRDRDRELEKLIITVLGE